jgi:hypothetical protein
MDMLQDRTGGGGQMARKVLEITLKSLTIQHNGEITRQDGHNLLTVSLIYPGPGKPTITTVKPLSLGEGMTVNFDAAPYTYADRILFKEEVIGPTLLVAQLTDVEVLSKFNKFMAGLFSTAFSAAWSAFAPGGGNLLLAAATHSVAALQLDTLKTTDGDRLYVIGRASLPIDTAQALPAGTVPLVVPADVKRDKFVFAPGSSQPIKKEQFILAAGQQNGSITFGIREL